MSRRGFVSRMSTAASAIAVAASLFLAPTGAPAQDRPADLTMLPPVPTTYTPKKTSWGDYDFSATWTIENIPATRILFQRPKPYGNRVWLNDAEFAKRLDAAKKSDESFGDTPGIGTRGTQGLAEWVQNSSFGHRTSMLVSPTDGQLPPLTPEAQKLYKAGRSSWVPGQQYDWVDDFDTWDRCVSRGFPASMYPFRYNNGIRVFQAPGYVVIELEMLGTRVIPLRGAQHWPKPVEAWMGSSVGHWEGKTLVIETTNIQSGDSATHDVTKRAASPLNMATQNVPAFNTIPTSTQAKVVERLTMTGPNTIVHELTYSDPDVFTAPWTTRIEWKRDDSYQFFEYACHEGDVQIRGYISSSKAARANPAVAQDSDSRERFAVQFDYDPAAGDAPAGFGPPGGRPPSAPPATPPAAPAPAPKPKS